MIVTSGAGVPAARAATGTIPIVFALANDPLNTGLVANLARPGANVTGLSLLAPDLAGKRLELLREMLPNFRRLTVIGNGSYPAAVLEMKELETAAKAFRLAVTTAEIRTAQEIAPTIAATSGHADAVYVCADPLVNTHRLRINGLAAAARLPTIYNFSEYVRDGGVLSYGPDITALFRRCAEIINALLRGAKPADIPVEQPTKFELVINLRIAKALGLEVPATLLARADEVIE
jgi:putative tryptophan/tyrosine transport system substrate-binding protein